MKRALVLSMVLAVSVFVGSAWAQVSTFVIDGFENSANPLAWQEVSPNPGQVTNAINGTVPTYTALHVTEGAASGEFTHQWIVPATETSTNDYVSGGPTTYWSMRVNIGAPTGSPNNNIPFAASTFLKADIYNNTNDTIQFSFCLRDSGGTGGLERTPFVALPPNAVTNYSWQVDTSAGAVVSFVTGDGKLDGTSAILRGMFFYTDTAPTTLTYDMFIDNIRVETGVADITPPAVPVILAAEQGSATGKLKVTWQANTTDSDIQGYNVYLVDDSGWGNPIGDRLKFPGTPAQLVLHPATSAEFDVTPGAPIYVQLTAVDTTGNESMANPSLGACLMGDGSKPSDLVVLDLDQYLPAEPNFATNGYQHDIVYYAQALNTKGRFFESCAAKAVEGGTVNLTPNPVGIVYWVNNRDGDAGPTGGRTIDDANVAKITTFVNAGGKFMTSGTALGEDLFTNGSAAGIAFFTNVLKAVLVSDNAADFSLDAAGVAPFTTAGAFQTGDDVFDLAAGATTDNEVYTAGAGATAAIDYVPAAAGKAAVYSNNQIVLFGFAFETVRDNATATMAGAQAKRAALLSDTIDYLLAGVSPTPSPTPLPQTGARTWTLFQ